MFGLSPLPYRPQQGLVEDLYNKAWQNQKTTIKKALTNANKYSKLGKQSWAKQYYMGVAYIRFMMHYADMIAARIRFLGETGEDFDLNQIRDQYKILQIMASLPCISNCKGVNLRKAFVQILQDFGITILLQKEIPICPGIGIMVVNSTLDDAFIVGGSQCIGEEFSEYDPDEYDNEEYTINVTSI